MKENSEVILWNKIKKIIGINNKIDDIYEATSPVSFKDNILTLSVENGLYQTALLKKKEEIEKAIDFIVPNPDKNNKARVEIIIEKHRIEEYDEYKEESLESDNSKNKSGSNNNLKENISDDYTFDGYIVGKNNEFAVRACTAIINKKAIYNPLLIFGDSGLGKTHLAQAVGRELANKNPKAKILYYTAEMFTNEFTNTLYYGKLNKIDAFRNKLRNLDLFIIDDIQFFETIFKDGKGKIEEEFFNTFDTLHTNKKQLVVISDRYPQELKNFTDRIITRLNSGVTIQINKPDYETRYLILKKLNEKEEVKMTDDMLRYIAEEVTTNIREVKGVFNSIAAMGSLLNKEITMELVKEELNKRIKEKKSKITARKIIEIVAEYYSIEVENILSKKRNKEIMIPRNISTYLIKEKLDINLTSIGKIFKKEHSTIISNLRSIEKLMKENEDIKKDVIKIKERIAEQ